VAIASLLGLASLSLIFCAFADICEQRRPSHVYAFPVVLLNEAKRGVPEGDQRSAVLRGQAIL